MSQPGAPTSPLYNVADYGATGDGTTDDTPAIRAAIEAAAPPSAPTGNTVFFPAGRYRVRSGLVVPPGVALEGCGWNTPGSQVNVFAGSWIFVEAGAPFSPVTISGSGGAVRRLAFNVPDQNTSGAPASAQPMVLVTGNNAVIEDVFLFNPFGGIYLNGGAQSTIRRLFGQPIQYGIVIDGSRDTNYIDGVHFWPYWQPIASSPAAVYQLEQGVAISLLRCDNPHLSNIFAYNYNAGLSLSSSSAGIPHKVHLVNADFDNCVTGVRISAPGVAGNRAGIQMANVTIQSPVGSGTPAGNGIWVQAASSYAFIQASNVRISSSGSAAVRVDADNVQFYGENVSLENWRGDVGFYISSPSSFAYLGAGFAYTPGATPYGPATQFHLARLS